MKFNIAKTAAIIGVAFALNTTVPALAGSDTSTPISGAELAASLNKQFNSNTTNSTKAFGLWGALLDMGARANGTLVNADKKHQAWCARFHKSYDAQSNTYAQFNGKRRACVSPYG